MKNLIFSPPKFNQTLIDLPNPLPAESKSNLRKNNLIEILNAKVKKANPTTRTLFLYRICPGAISFYTPIKKQS